MTLVFPARRSSYRAPGPKAGRGSPASPGRSADNRRGPTRRSAPTAPAPPHPPAPQCPTKHPPQPPEPHGPRPPAHQPQILASAIRACRSFLRFVIEVNLGIEGDSQFSRPKFLTHRRKIGRALPPHGLHGSLFYSNTRS